MCGVLKAARRPLTDEWKRFDLDADGWERLETLADRLVRHANFEHLERERIRRGLRDAVRDIGTLRVGDDPPASSSPPRPWTGWRRIRSAARFISASSTSSCRMGPSLATCGSFVCPRTRRWPRASHGSATRRPRWCARWRRSAAPMSCSSSGRRTAERALALARQQILFGFMSKIYLD